MDSGRRLNNPPMISRLTGLVVLALALLSCEENRVYRLATHQETTRLPRIGEDLAEVLRKDHGWRVKVLAGESYNSVANIGKVASGEVDFAISVSSAPADDSLDVRTVLPLYPEILVVLYKGDEVGRPDDLEELLAGRRVGVGPKDSSYSQIMLQIIEAFGVDAGTFTPVHHPLNELDLEAMDVAFTFVGANPTEIEKHIKAGARIFSFDDAALDGKGSRVDGYLLKSPGFRSFIIPKSTFDEYPEEPVLTLAVTMTLISRGDMEPAMVYDFVSAVFNRSSALFRKNPVLGFLS